MIATLRLASIYRRSSQLAIMTHIKHYIRKKLSPVASSGNVWESLTGKENKCSTILRIKKRTEQGRGARAHRGTEVVESGRRQSRELKAPIYKSIKRLKTQNQGSTGSCMRS